MLAAAGIDSDIGYEDGRYVLRVPEAAGLPAAQQLASYESERRAARIRAPAGSAPHPHPGAWLGCAVFIAVQLGVARMLSAAAPGAFASGTLDAAAVRAGEWWRAWTALTLHWDAPHLLANLGAGAWFGYFAGRQVGVGVAWLLIVSGAAAANLFDAAFGPASYHSAGASTAVFTALGLLAAHSWRTRLHPSRRWAERVAPLLGGALLLGWLGSAGEGTDLVAHALGFSFGCVLGAGAALPAVSAWLLRVPQWLGAAGALGSVAFAWWLALSR